MGRDSFGEKKKLGLRCEVYILLTLFFIFYFFILISGFVPLDLGLYSCCSCSRHT